MALRGYRWRVKALDGIEGIEREQLEQALAEMPLRYLAEMEEFDVSVGWGSFKKDGSLHTEGPIEVHGFRSPYGLMLHPPDNGASRAKYRLGGRWDTFQALVALSDKGKEFRSSLSFSVHGDGKLLWSSSPITRPGRAQKCKLSVARVEVLELRVDCRGQNAFGLGAWIDPFVMRK